MELLFNNKETIEQILCRAEKVPEICLSNDKSYVIEGENFFVLAGLLKNKKGCVDLVYIDPPFNTNQKFVLSENRANTISQKRNATIAYNDLMDEDEFIKFIYERFVLIYELLSEEGSLYVHIDAKNGHYFKIVLDEIFGKKNFKNDISRIKSNPKNFDRRAFGNEKDMILFYAKNSKKNIWNEVKSILEKEEKDKRFPKIDKDGRRYTTIPLHAPGETVNGVTGMSWRGLLPPEGRHWRTTPEDFEKMDEQGLIEWSKNGNPRIKKYADEHKGKKIQDIWKYKDPQNPLYPTQKNLDLLKLIIRQSSKENSIIMDCFSGSGTTLIAAGELNRKFIGVDISETAINITAKRLKKEKIDFTLLKI